MIVWSCAGSTLKVMAVRLHRKIKAVRKVIATNKDLPEQGTLPLAEQQSGHARLSSAGQENQLHQYWTAHPFKTATELKSEVAAGSNISDHPDCLPEEAGHTLPLHCQETAPH